MRDTPIHPAGYVVLVLAILTAGWYWYGAQIPETISEVQMSMESDIRSMGPEEAYQALKERNKEKNIDTNHNMAHLFGKALHTVQGLPGLTTCDTEFEFGCYHGFFTAAVSEHGLEIIRELDDICHESKGSELTACQHGIGHGIIEFLGTHRLTEALAACTMTEIVSPDAGCLTGVFMQYNIPLSVDDNGVFTFESRPFTSTLRPYEPCPSVASEFQIACYHELPQWWDMVREHDFDEMGKWCEAVPEYPLRMACYAGLGSIVASYSKYEPIAAAELCSTMPSEPGRIQCLHNAAWILYLSAGDLDGAQYLCAQKPEEEQMRCPPGNE